MSPLSLIPFPYSVGHFSCLIKFHVNISLKMQFSSHCSPFSQRTFQKKSFQIILVPPNSGMVISSISSGSFIFLNVVRTRKVLLGNFQWKPFNWRQVAFSDSVDSYRWCQWWSAMLAMSVDRNATSRRNAAVQRGVEDGCLSRFIRHLATISFTNSTYRIFRHVRKPVR